jgi:hypothetical protein
VTIVSSLTGLVVLERTAPPSKRVEIFDHFLARFLDNFILTGAYPANLDRYDQTLSPDYKFLAPVYANSTGDPLGVRPRLVGDRYTGRLNLFAEKKPRIYPIQLEEATRRKDLFDITLPVGYVVDRLPPPVQADYAYASYHSEVEVSDGKAPRDAEFSAAGCGG